MSRFVLKPCRLRDGKLVPEKESESITMTWRELVSKLAPSNRVEALKTLQYLQRGAFVGLLDRGGNMPPSNFCFVAQDRSGNISEVIRRNPSFSRKLKEVYQVVELERDSGMMESGITPSAGA
jgi:hypothetical protein